MTANLSHGSSTVARRTSSFGTISFAAILLLVFAAGSLAWAIWELRTDARREAFEETGNLAVVLAGQLSRFLQTIDIGLAETRDDLDLFDSDDKDGWRNAIASKGTYDKLRGRLARLPQAFNIAVADVNGHVVVSTASWPAPAINVADRDYFRNARAQVYDELTISSPIKNRINGQSTIVFARSLKDPRGQFLGVVYLSVNTSYFEIIYDSIQSVRDLTFILALTTNGTVLVRHPGASEITGQRIPKGSPWYENVAKGGGSFFTPGAFGGAVRLASVRPLQGFPLAVAVSTSEDGALARWRTQAAVLGLGGVTFVACSLSLLVIAGRKMRSLAASEASLREKSESLEQSIAERAEMEKRLVQSQKLEAIGQLTGGIAHDFNNLLLVVIGNLDLLKDTTPPGSSELELIESSLTAALTGSELSNSLLAFSRQHASKLETVDIKTVVADQVRLLKRAMGRRITLEEASAADVFPVTADAAQLRCALTNLVVNARDAMPDGGTITVRTRNAELTEKDLAADAGLKPGDYVVMEVTDTGVGISPENLQRIFDPFFTTKEVGKGTGLGLSMVYGFVKDMKGKIKVTSEVGKGTTFSIFLARTVELQTLESPTIAPIEGSAPASKRETVLVVDDDDMVRKSVVAQLVSLGYGTIEASSPAEALEVIAGQAPIDLLFSDIVMPGPIDGVDLARLAREHRPELRVLLTSGYPDLKTARSSQETYDQWDILKKPYRRNELQEALLEALGADARHDLPLRAAANAGA